MLQNLNSNITEIGAKLKLGTKLKVQEKNSNLDKTQIGTILISWQNLSFDKTQLVTIQIVIKLKLWKLKVGHNSNCDET